MEHADSRTVDLYVAGGLPAAESERFEEHLIECAACREQVEWAEGLRGSLRELAADESARAAARIGLVATLAARLRRPVLWAAALVLVALPALLLVRLGAVDRELAAARAAAHPDLAAALDRERDTTRRLGERIAALERPQANPLVASLGVLRGDPGAMPSAHRLRLGSTPTWLLLAIEPPAPDPAAYRATLAARDGRTLWRTEALTAGADGNLSLAVPPGFLAPGRYRLHLESKSVASAGAWDVPFEILAAR